MLTDEGCQEAPGKVAPMAVTRPWWASEVTRAPAQAAGGQVAEERQPAGAVLSGADLQPEDLPVPVSVHPGREQGVHVDYSPALADLEHQGVRGDKRVGALVQRPGSEIGDLGVELG